MTVFAHHLYEYRKGLRRLVLHTTGAENEELIVKTLNQRKIPHTVRRISEKKINVFFGSRSCIDVLESFPHLDLARLSPDRDFILGAMLGYDIKAQCRRYLRKIGCMHGKPAVERAVLMTIAK
jgi:hypothetical protein